MKETELKNTSETSEREVQNLSGQDKARKHRKTAKAAISFIVMIVLLVALFFAAVNIGSLKVSFPELLKGLFVKYNEDVATIYDLRFPRIVISMLAGAAIAELTGKMEEFMNDLIGERMEQVYQEKDGQQYDPFNEKLETKLQKIFQKLSDKQRTILFDYMTETSNKCSDLNEFYYRMGLRDGLMLKEALQVMLDALTV